MQSRWLLFAILTAWLFLFVYSFYAAAGVVPTDDGFLRGMNRVNIFLRWHAAAFAFAIAAAFVGWRTALALGRWLSKGPLVVHILAATAVLGTALYGHHSNTTADRLQEPVQTAPTEPK